MAKLPRQSHPVLARCLACCLAFVSPGSAQELLLDGDLESSQPDGTFPSSGAWLPGFLGEAGSIVIGGIGVTGNGLYLYTGRSGKDFWTGPHQDRRASPGQVFQATAFVRCPDGAREWVDGTRARVHLAFLDAATNVLNSVQSHVFNEPLTNWQRLEVTSRAAPPDTAFVRYACVLEKPRGVTNISVVVFDSCSLRPGTFTGIEVWPRAVGVPLRVSSTEMFVANSGNTYITWSAANLPPWLSIVPNSGLLAPGTQQPLALQIQRPLLPPGETVIGSFQFLSDAGTSPARVFVEKPSTPVPRGPALVHIDGYQLLVQDRLPDGTLAPPVPWAVKGVTWSPSSRGSPDVFDVRRADFLRWYVADVQLLREMNANTVYTFLDFGTNQAASEVLDNLYRNGIKALVTVDENGTGNTNAIRSVVTAYRDHPAILGWVIGNEWNINLYHGRFASEGYHAAAAFTETLARLVKALDTNHFVLSTHGDIFPPEMQELANQLCPSVDAWGLNVYRGGSFTDLFSDWKSITTRPMMLSEFGTDGFRTLMLKVDEDGAIISADGAVDPFAQADWNRNLWREIASNLSADAPESVCLGGTVFEWSDEWWKAQGAFGGKVGRHDTLGFYASWNPESHPDSVANEEWWGLVTADRIPKLSYRYFQEDFAAVRASIRPGTNDHLWIAWPAKTNVQYTLYSHEGSLTVPGAFAPLLPFTNITTLSNGLLQLSVPTGQATPARHYRVVAEPR